MIALARAAARQVAAATEAKSIPVEKSAPSVPRNIFPDNTAGWTKMM